MIWGYHYFWKHPFVHSICLLQWSPGCFVCFFPEKFPENLLEKVLYGHGKHIPQILGIFCWRLIFGHQIRKSGCMVSDGLHSPKTNQTQKRRTPFAPKHLPAPVFQVLFLMEEILHHLWMHKTLANKGIMYQPQLVNAGFLNHQPYVRLRFGN